MSQTKKQFFFTPLSSGCDWSERQALGALGTTLAGQDDQMWELYRDTSYNETKIP